MKDKLMVQVVPTAGNEEMLAGIPHVEQEDMSLVYRFVIETNEQGSATTLVTNQMLENYGISAEQLHADAMANAPEQFPASVRSMQEVLAEIMGIEPEMMPGEPGGMYVVTCNQGVNGAGCIFYPEFMDQAAEKLGGDFFVLPSSVHEVILLPDTGDMSFHELESMVQEINATEVQPADRLSDSFRRVSLSRVLLRLKVRKYAGLSTPSNLHFWHFTNTTSVCVTGIFRTLKLHTGQSI